MISFSHTWKACRTDGYLQLHQILAFCLGIGVVFLLLQQYQSCLLIRM
nr:MAG TPA: hypothetical protein [Caudoviricetes sp.]